MRTCGRGQHPGRMSMNNRTKYTSAAARMSQLDKLGLPKIKSYAQTRQTETGEPRK